MSSPSTLQLCAAVKKRDLKEVQKLLDKGADINDKTIDGDTVLHVACYEGFADLVNQLLEHFARPNARDESGRTPLHIAAARGHMELCKILVNHRAKIHERDDFGNTPLKEATVAGHKEIVKYLRGAMNEGYMSRLRNVFSRR